MSYIYCYVTSTPQMIRLHTLGFLYSLFAMLLDELILRKLCHGKI